MYIGGSIIGVSGSAVCQSMTDRIRVGLQKEGLNKGTSAGRGQEQSWPPSMPETSLDW